MRRPRTGSLAGGIAACHVLGYAALVVLALLGQPRELVEGYRWSYAFLRALAELIEYLPAFAIAGAMVAFSMPASSARGTGAGTPVEALVRPAVATFVVLALIYTGLTGLAAPPIRRRVRDMEVWSLQADSYRIAMREAVTRAEETGSAADYLAAADAAARYLEVDPGDGEIARLETEYRGEYLKLRAAAGEARPAEAAVRPAAGAEGEDPAGLLRRAEAYYRDADYYSAHYYATLAQRGAEVRVQAATLVAAAEREISPSTPLGEKLTAEERKALARAREKREAYAMVERGDWLGAYYRFGELALLYPGDADVRTYRRLSEEKVLAAAFPIGEAREALRLPGVENVLYARDRPDGEREVVSVRKMVRAPGGVYFSDVELMRLEPGKGPTLHLSARYGKLAGRVVLLHALDPEAREHSAEPVVMVQENPADLTVSLELGYEPELLASLSARPGALGEVPAGVLWSIRPWARGSGLLAEAVDLELLMFFVRPALFFALCLFALSASLRYRASYYGARGPAAYAAFALFPLAAAGLWQLAAAGARLGAAACLAAAGFVPAAIAAGACLVVLSVVALIALARAFVD